MDRAAQHPVKLLSGVLRLYRAGSGREFYAFLKRLLAEHLRGATFSTLVPQGGGNFSIEYSSLAGGRALEKPVIRSLELDRILREGKDCDLREPEPSSVQAGHREIPIEYVKVMSHAGRRLGLLAFHDGLTEEAVEILSEEGSFLFHHAFSALDLARQNDQARRSLEQGNVRLQAIEEIGTVLGQLELELLLAHLLAIFTRLTSAQVGSIALSEGLAGDAEWGLMRDVLDKIRRRGGSTLREIAMATKEPVLACEYAGNPEYEPVDDFRVESVLCVPLVAKDRVLGTVNLVNTDGSKGGMFTETDKDVVVTISSLAATALENGFLHRELLEQERIKASLQIASRIQQGMYPQQIPRIAGYEMAWATRNCEETGGDYFDCMRLEDGRLAVAIGDVSGHGIGAALHMAASRANLRALFTVRQDLRELSERMNQLLAADMDGDSFMTLFVMYVDAARHSISYINAGHDRPLHYSRAESRVSELKSTGCALGMMAGASYDQECERNLLPGDVLLLSTDGIWEVSSKTGQRFGKQRLRAALSRHAGAGAREIADGILAEVKAFSEGVPQEDDQTLAVLKRLE